MNTPTEKLTIPQQIARPLFALVLGNTSMGFLLGLLVPYGWQVGIANIVVSICVLGFGLWFGYHVRRAYHFQVFQVVWSGLFSIQIMLWGILLAVRSIGASWWILCAVVAISILFSAVWQFQDVRRRLRETRRYNETNGCFNSKTGMWFPGRQLNTREPNQRRNAIGADVARWGIVLAVILGPIIAKSGQALVIETALCFMLAFGSVLNAVYQLGTTREILELENLWNKPIVVGDMHSHVGKRA